ncbi:hypothetical protein D3C86_808210 [compost metagenome]
MGPKPKMNIGHNAMLMAFESHSILIAVEASPAPRKIPLITMRRIKNPLDANMTIP